MSLPLLHPPGASLPALETTAFRQVLTNGGHHPLLFQMEHQQAPAGLWVLKPVFSMSASNRRAGLGVIAEIVGLHVCGWLGVATPAGGLFRFPDDASRLVETVAASNRAEIGEVFSLNRNLLAVPREERARRAGVAPAARLQVIR